MTDIDPDVLARYLSGEASAADTAATLAWVADDPQRARELEALRLAWESAAASPTPEIIEASLARVLVRTGQAASSTAHLVRDVGVEGRMDVSSGRVSSGLRPSAGRPYKGTRPYTLWFGIAAAVALALTVGRGAVRSHATAGREYVTAAGQRMGVTLVDGTQFTLAPASRLRLAADYGRGGRDVYLEGEAYFAVAHDATRPFAVHAANAVATDIGTQFDVRAYADDPGVRVAVVKGRVEVVERAGRDRSSTGPLPRPYNGNDKTLNAGDVETVTDSDVAIAHGADVAALTGWTDGTLAFRDVPLAEVLAEVGRWYGLDVRLADASIGGRPIRATFTTEPLDVVLAAITHTVGARYTQRGNRVTVMRGE